MKTSTKFGLVVGVLSLAGVSAGWTISGASQTPGESPINPGVTAEVLNDLARSQGKADAKDPLMAWTADCLQKMGQKAEYDNETGLLAFDGDAALFGKCFDQLRHGR